MNELELLNGTEEMIPENIITKEQFVKFVENSVKFEEEVKICPLCGKPYKGWGNNPYPLNVGKVCDKCNLNVIIPMRIIMNRNKSNQKSEEI